MTELTVTQPHFRLAVADNPCACELCGAAVAGGDRLVLVPAFRTSLPVCLDCSRRGGWVVEEPPVAGPDDLQELVAEANRMADANPGHLYSVLRRGDGLVICGEEDRPGLLGQGFAPLYSTVTNPTLW